MKPIFWALKRVRLLSDTPFMDSPSTWTSPSERASPSERSSRPERTFNSVVFPDPEGPMMATISPRPTPRSTPRSALTRSPPAAYTFWTPVASIMKSAAAFSTKPPRSVAYTLRSNHRRVAPDSHRTPDRSCLGLRTERLHAQTIPVALALQVSPSGGHYPLPTPWKGRRIVIEIRQKRTEGRRVGWGERRPLVTDCTGSGDDPLPRR